MQTNDQVELEISNLAYGGRGVARHDGRVVFVPGAALGERVRARIVKAHAKFAEADLMEILQASPARITPSCPLAGVCPGCCYQHLDYAEELRVKSMQIKSLMQRMAHLEQFEFLPAQPSPQPLGYRNKIVLHADIQPDTPARWGYYGHDNRTILDVPACPLADPRINDKLAELRAGGVDCGKGEKASTSAPELTLRCTRLDGAQYWVGTPDPRAPWLREETLLGELRVPRGSFFQVNPAVANLLTAAVQARIKAWQPPMFWDVYCGAGLFALAAAAAGVPSAAGVDNDGGAIRAARHNARKLSAGGIHFEKQDAAAGLRQLAQAHPGADALIMLDPPRTGLERNVIAALAELRPNRIIYSSCAADTLARDLARLAQAGYRLESLQIFDMFPRTMHCECLACLERAPAG